MSEDFVTSWDGMRWLFNSLTEKIKRRSFLPGVPTGFIRLDKTLGGLRPGDVVVIGGKPGTGKSAFAAAIISSIFAHERRAQFAGHLRRSKTSVVYFDLETSAERQIHRMLSQHSRVKLTKVEYAHLEEDEFSRLTVAASDIAGGDLKFVDKRHLTPTQMESILRNAAPAAFRSPVSAAPENASLVRSDSEKAEAVTDFVVVVDSVQEIVSDQRGQNRDEEMCWNMSALKSLARSFQCAMVVVSRLNRRWDSRQKPTPQLQDLRDSGSIEDIADAVLLLEPSNGQDPHDVRQIDLIVAKNRNGPRGKIAFTFDPECGAFSEVQPEDHGDG